MSDGVNGPEPASADEFDRALRELTAGRPGPAKFREPSAAERARAAAAADKRARKQAARTRRKARRFGRLTVPLALLLALALTRKLLVAAALNQQTLLGGKPAAFERLLTNGQRSDFLASLHKTGLNKDGTDRNLRSLLVAFAPGSTVLVGSEIKVHGTMSASADTVQGTHVLDIGINYRFVYAVEPPHQPAAWQRVIVAYGDDVEFGNWADSATSFDPWVDWSQFDAGADCVSSDGYIHPDYQTALPKGVQPSGPARDPYSMANPPSTTGCVLASRT